jgi:hypothetical protein
MVTQSLDTSPDIESVLVHLVRKAGPAEKMLQVRSFSQTVMQLSKRAIARRNKHFSEQEVNLMFVSLHYGKELAERLRNYLDNHEKT